MKNNSAVRDGAARAAKPARRRIIMILLICAAITALAEFAYSSRKTLVIALSGAPEVELSLAEASYGNGFLMTEDGLKVISGGRIAFDPGGVKVKYIALTFNGKKIHVPVSVFATDEARRTELRRYQTETVYLGENRAVIGYDSAGGVSRLAIEFPEEAKNTVITGVTLNSAFGFGFNAVRWMLVLTFACAAVFIKEYRLFSRVYRTERIPHRVTVIAAAVFCGISALIGSVKNMEFVKYPFERPVEKYTCYQQQTDAFLKGRLDLDIEFDAEELASLENPYDLGARYDTSSYVRLWDRAYNAQTGKVYSYFGVSPVLLVYLPVTALTGYMPGDGAVSLACTLAATAAFAAALIALVRFFGLKPDLVTLFSGVCAVCCGSLIYVLNVHPSMYYTAVICGMLFFALTVNFSFRAVMAQKNARRRFLLCLAGICAALTVASRPNAFLYTVMLIPLFFDFFFRQKRAAKQKLAEFAFAAVPVAIGAAAIMWYNAARFGSPFDFGATRQLTFYDMSYAGLALYKFFPAMYHYFIQPVGFTAEFPFLDIANTDLGVYRSYEYIFGSAGALNFPAAWGVFGALPVTKGNKVKRFTYIAAAAAAVFVAFADFCLAGSHIRYMGDIMFPLCLVGALVLFELVSLSEGRPCAVHVRAAVWIVFGLTVLVASALLFANEADNIRVLAPGVFHAFERLFE